MIWIGLWVFFFLCSYILYPQLIALLAGKRKVLPYKSYLDTEELPQVAVFMSLHNEEKVLARKLESILQSNYPKEKVSVYIGLDDCNDRSEQIVRDVKKLYPDNVHYISTERRGKPQMLNYLQEHFRPVETVSVFTDANVFFTPDTIFELVRYFKDDDIGLVDSRFQLSREIVSHELEGEYLNFEQTLKFNEGKKWGVMQGPFGGCFAIRTALYQPVPDNFLVDDFFISMCILRKGYKGILNPEAIVIEEVHTSWKDEFRRKSRISAGNFQNLSYFSDILIKPFTPLAFSWFFHKVVRWVLPILLLPVLLLGWVEMYLLNEPAWLPIITLILILGGASLLYILHKLNLQSRTIERLSYFIYINLAMLQGFIIYIKGIKSNVWKPTQRK